MRLRPPANFGGTDAFAQASVMELYDSERGKAPTNSGNEATWEDFSAWAKTEVTGSKVATVAFRWAPSREDP